MPLCKNNSKKIYKGDEPSPKGFGYCAHTENIGTIKKGKDGNKWIIVSTLKGIKRWIKYRIIKKHIKKNNSDISSKIKIYSEKDSLNQKWWNDSDKCDCSKFVSYKRNPMRKYGILYKDIHGLELEKGKLHKFISYNNFSKTSTKINIDAWIKYKLPNKIIEEDFCGSKKKINKDNPFFKKIKNAHKGYEIYFPRWDFNKHYAIYINNKKSEVYIYCIPDKYNKIYYENLDFTNWNNNSWIYIKSVAKIISNKILFITKNNADNILLEIIPNRYIFIGGSILSFTSKNKIIKFDAIIGNNGDIYPYAIDIDDNFYIFYKNVFINKKSIMSNKNINDIYFDSFRSNPVNKYLKIDNVKIIHDINI